MRYVFLPTLDTVAVTYGTTFAFVNLETRKTELTGVATLGEAATALDTDVHLARFRLRDVIRDAPPDAKLSTLVTLTTDDTARAPTAMCLGCFLRRRYRTQHSATVTHQPAPQTKLHTATDGYLAVFPTPTRRIATVARLTPHACAKCTGEYRHSGIWREAGIAYDGRAQRVVSPLLVPFAANNFAEYTQMHLLRDRMYLGYWPWPITDEEQASLRPFREEGTHAVFDALEAVALVQDDKQVRNIGNQVSNRLSVLLTEAYRDVTTRADLDELLLHHEWVGSERFVVQFMLGVWDPRDTNPREFKQNLLSAAMHFAAGMPLVTSAKARLRGALTDSLRRGVPARTAHFLSVVRDTCIEHRVIPYGDVYEKLLDLATAPQALDVLDVDMPSLVNAMAMFAVAAPPPDSDLRLMKDAALRRRERGRAARPVAAIRGLEYNAATLAQVSTRPGEADFIRAETATTAMYATVFSLKADLLSTLLPLRMRPGGVPIQTPGNAMQTGTLTTHCTVHAVASGTTATLAAGSVSLILAPERVGASAPIVYSVFVAASDHAPELRTHIVVPLIPYLDRETVMVHAIDPLLAEVNRSNWTPREREHAADLFLREFPPTTPAPAVFEEAVPVLPYRDEYTKLVTTIGLIPPSRLLLSPIPRIQALIIKGRGFDELGVTQPDVDPTKFQADRVAMARVFVAENNKVVAAVATHNTAPDAVWRAVRSAELRMTSLLSISFTRQLAQDISIAASGTVDIQGVTRPVFTLTSASGFTGLYEIEALRHMLNETQRIAKATGHASTEYSVLQAGPFFVDVALILRTYFALFDVNGNVHRMLIDARRSVALDHVFRQKLLVRSVEELQRILGAFTMNQQATPCAGIAVKGPIGRVYNDNAMNALCMDMAHAMPTPSPLAFATRFDQVKADLLEWLHTNEAAPAISAPVKRSQYPNGQWGLHGLEIARGARGDASRRTWSSREVPL